MGRRILAVLAGIVVGGIVVAIVEKIGHELIALPEGIDPNNLESLKANMDKIPLGALLFVLLAWISGSFGGGWLAAYISKISKTADALIVGGVLMIFGIMNMWMIPTPLWMWVSGILVFLPSAYAGARLVKQ